MSRADRKRRTARRRPYRDSKPVILVVAEGSVTEKEYLNGLISHHKNPRVNIKVVGGAGAPMTIVGRAKKLRDEAKQAAKSQRDDNLSYDAVWCVFDRDEHPQFKDAKQMARDNGLELAVSNPCFELWLYLHFTKSPGMQDRHKMKDKLKRHLPSYDKHVDFQLCVAGYPEAERRAKHLDEVALLDKEEGRNPTTGVWQLTESIRKTGKVD